MYILLVSLLIHGSAVFAEDSTTSSESAASVVNPPPNEAVKVQAATADPTAKKALSGRVSKIYPDSKKVVVTLDRPVQPDEVSMTWEFTNAKSESCEGKTLQAQDKNVFVDFSGCTNFDQISGGAVISPSLFQNLAQEKENVAPPQPAPEGKPAVNPPQSPSNAETKSRWNSPRLSLGLGSSGANKFKFDSVTFRDSSSSATGSESFDVESAAQISILFMIAPVSSWGFEGGFTFESKRDVNSVTETIEGQSSHANFISPKPSLQFNILEANALYRWDVVYLPFGLNYSFAQFKAASGSLASISCTGRVGAQLGIGFIAGEHWHFELLYQQLSAYVTIANSTLSADLGTGTLGGGVLRAAYIF